MNRRDFLKVLAVAPAAVAVGKSVIPVSENQTFPVITIFKTRSFRPWFEVLETELDTFVCLPEGWYSLRHKKYVLQSPRAPRCILENIA